MKIITWSKQNSINFYTLINIDNFEQTFNNYINDTTQETKYNELYEITKCDKLQNYNITNNNLEILLKNLYEEKNKISNITNFI